MNRVATAMSPLAVATLQRAFAAALLLANERYLRISSMG
jgi:hypothetical protein